MHKRRQLHRVSPNDVCRLLPCVWIVKTYWPLAHDHFFDTVYYPSLDHVAGRPYGLWVHGNNDTVGAANAVDKVATVLALNKAADVLEVIGTIDAGVRNGRMSSVARWPRR
jgi:hypothetical protein